MVSIFITAVAAAAILVAIWTVLLVRVEHAPLKSALRAGTAMFGPPAVIAGIAATLLPSSEPGLVAGIAVVTIALVAASAILVRRFRSKWLDR